MRKTRIMSIAALLVAMSVGAGELTVTPTLATDYDLHGITQTALDPAFQLRIDYAHESGVYGFLWGGNVDSHSYPGANLEMDAGVGYAMGNAQQGLGYDFGVMVYTYPGASDFNFPEIWGGLSHDGFTGRLRYSWDAVGSGTPGWYAEINGEFPLQWKLKGLTHVGYSFGNFWSGNEHVDYSVGLSRRFGLIDVAVKYIGSDLPDASGTRVFDTRGRLWASISTRLPWTAQ
jgi:uncharacterized protein (TIGR02001 family)